jgi:hypothetical protein
MSEPVSVVIVNGGSFSNVHLTNNTDQDLLVATKVDGTDDDSPYDVLVGELNGPSLLKAGATSVAGFGRYGINTVTSVDVIVLCSVRYNAYTS